MNPKKPKPLSPAEIENGLTVALARLTVMQTIILCLFEESEDRARLFLKMEERLNEMTAMAIPTVSKAAEHLLGELMLAVGGPQEWRRLIRVVSSKRQATANQPDGRSA